MKKAKQSPAKQPLYDTKVNPIWRTDAATRWELIRKAAQKGAHIQNLKLVLWDLVTESRVDRKAPIDVMPYVKRIRKIFEKNIISSVKRK